MPNKPPHLDLTQAASPLQILPRKPSLSSHSANWNGIILRQYSQLPPHGFPEYYPQQHLIIIHQQPDRTRVTRKINGKKQNLLVNTEDVVFIPAQHSHGAAWQAELELMVLIIDPNFVSQVAYEWIDPDRIELLPCFSHCDRFLMQSLMGETPKTALHRFISQVGLQLKNSLLTTENRFYAQSMATALASHLIQHYSTKKPVFQNDAGGLSRSRLEQIKNYMRDRLTENLTLQEISNEAGLSRCYFAQMFKQSTGIAPYQYIIQQRVERAKQLLKEDLPLVEVALECGFSSQSSFNRTFKKSVGTTPKGYRQKL